MTAMENRTIALNDLLDPFEMPCIACACVQRVYLAFEPFWLAPHTVLFF